MGNAKQSTEQMVRDALGPGGLQRAKAKANDQQYSVVVVVRDCYGYDQAVRVRPSGVMEHLSVNPKDIPLGEVFESGWSATVGSDRSQRSERPSVESAYERTRPWLR